MHRQLPPWTGPLGVLLLALILFPALYLSFPVLYDTDSYYHLAIARAYRSVGQLQDLPWARFSVLHEGFGDKELLFHWLLAPFAASPNGGRLALGLLDAALAGALAALAYRAAGPWGLVVPLLVLFGSLDVLGRILRLRPELLSLLLLLAALTCAAGRRYRLLGVVALAYALSYTAFHALLLLCLAWFLHQGLVRRRWEWPLLLYPTAGIGLGLVLHPNFPHTLVVWKIQSIDFLLLKDRLDVGSEIGAATTAELLQLNAGWILGMAVLVLASRRRPEEEERTGESVAVSTAADLTGVAALLFSLLYLLGQRFSIYAVPFVTLALLFELRRRGSRPGAFVPLPGGRRFPTLLLLAIVVVVLLVPAGRQLSGMARARGSDLGREEDWGRAGAALPAGARTAATWGLGQLFLYFAPQATFLNVLDPVFMAVPYPEAYAAQRELFDGVSPDVPLLLERELLSDHLLLSRFHDPPDLLERIAADPRLELLYAGYTLVYRVVPQRNGSFLLDWRIAPESLAPPLPPTADPPSWPFYPRAEGRERELEGFVDLTRIGPPPGQGGSGCRLLTAELPPAATGQSSLWELAPWGPTSLWLGGRLVVTVNGRPGAIVGQGVEVDLETGKSVPPVPVAVFTCWDPTTSRGGFYLRRLPEQAPH